MQADGIQCSAVMVVTGFPLSGAFMEGSSEGPFPSTPEEPSFPPGASCCIQQCPPSAPWVPRGQGTTVAVFPADSHQPSLAARQRQTI